jgi:hypothetical protein
MTLAQIMLLLGHPVTGPALCLLVAVAACIAGAAIGGK